MWNEASIAIWHVDEGDSTVDVNSLKLILNELLIRIQTLEEQVSDLRGEVSGHDKEWE